ncbi:metallophosphoesterase, partial [Candidatus Dojkabacteria bacterium]|nr:metallophosphoesterase [Candidatus Dojkabacteria bacterium]
NVHLPFFIGFGNHDYLGCTDCYLNYTGTGKWMMPSAYYSIDYGDLLAIMIDTENFNSEQQDWLTSELEKPQKWKVIFGHRPIITNDAVHTGEQWSGINEFQAIACDKADVYISGHAHLMEDMGNPEGCGMRQLVSGGGGTSVRNYTDAYPSWFELSDNGFVSVEISENALIFHYIDYHGNEVYTSQIEKVSY